MICLLDDQKQITEMGGTMRLGAQATTVLEGSHAAESYGAPQITERHRHRYEFNNAYRQQFDAHGMSVTGSSPDGSLVEIVEVGEHPWFMAVQFHPEFKSQPTKAHPLFAGFVEAAMERNRRRAESAAQAEPL